MTIAARSIPTSKTNRRPIQPQLRAAAKPGYARAVSIVEEFNADLLVVAVAFLLALVGFKLTQWLPVPAPALLLIAAAVASDVFPSSRSTSSRSSGSASSR